ncbi:MAG: DUF2332 domain-containing protein [Microthrixaceae bacterium]
MSEWARHRAGGEPAGGEPAGGQDDDAVGGGPEEWAGRFEAQALSCDTLGSPLYGRLLRLLALDCAAAGTTWDLVRPHAGLRFGQMGPLRLVGAAHRLALTGDADGWAACLPSCGGTPPPDDDALARAWVDLAGTRGAELSDGLTREVQTNEVGRAAALAYAAARARLPDGVRLVELGPSGGLNLRMDHYDTELRGPAGSAPLRLGDPASSVRLVPEVRTEPVPSAAMARIDERIGLDPHPIDAAGEQGAATLLSFVWPDQDERIARVRAALAVAAEVPVDLRRTDDTGVALEAVLAGAPRPTLVQHSIVWQYLPTMQRWHVTDVLEAAGARATDDAPLAWVRFEPDEWNRSRVAVWLRRWPGGADRLVAHADYHGRWLAPVPDAQGSPVPDA